MKLNKEETVSWTFYTILTIFHDLKSFSPNFSFKSSVSVSFNQVSPSLYIDLFYCLSKSTLLPQFIEVLLNYAIFAPETSCHNFNLADQNNSIHAFVKRSHRLNIWYLTKPTVRLELKQFLARYIILV